MTASQVPSPWPLTPGTAPGPAVLFNPVVRNLTNLAARAWKNKWVVTFAGNTGIGKTAALTYADANLPFPHQLFNCKQITTRHTLLRALGLKPGQVWTTHGRRWLSSPVLYDQAVERARTNPYLLMVEEADRLRMDCFEMLRDLWDDARLPMLLVGNDGLTSKIDRQHQRLFRRIRMRYEQKPLVKAELRKMLDFMGYEVTDEEFEFLWKLVGGSPGFAEALLANADAIAESHGSKRGIEDLAGAAKYFPSLKQ